MRDNLDLFARLAGLKGAARTARMDEVADVLELTDFMDRPARFLSGGEKRRLHTAMALVHRPKVLLLDEPTTGVDIATRSRLLDAIRALAPAEGYAVVYSTHYLPEVEELGASVAILDRGRLLARGPLDELVDRHGTGIVELSFDGPAPAVPGGLVEGATVRIRTERLGVDIAGILASLDADDAHGLQSVDLSRPSLENVFIAITGRAYRSDDEGPQGLDGDALTDRPEAARPRSVIQVNALTNAGAMLLGGLGGALTPVEFLPGWARFLAPATPAYWAMRGFRSVLFDGLGLAAVALPVAVLLGFSAVFVAVAIRRFRIEDTKVSWA